jgi:putative flippase GtrA
VNRLTSPLRHPLAQQFIRYVGVGGFSFLVDFATLYLLTDVAGWHYLLAATAAFVAGLVTNYLLCLRWVFDFHRMGNRLHEFVVFGIIGLAGLLLNNLLLFLLTEEVGLHYLLSKLFAAAFVLLFNFSLRRWMLFSPALARAATTLTVTP